MYRDKRKQLDCWNRWYKRHRAAEIKRRVERKRKIVEYMRSKRTKCVRCPETHPACLDFHHRDPATKLFNLASAARIGKTLKKIQAEIDKCDVLCANCHRKEHWQDRGML